jgi:hypothetical protein
MAPDMRPVLLGMNNPLSQKPEHALYPYPPGCTGHRIWMLLRTKLPDMSRLDYLRGFERTNLVSGPWNMTKARVRAAQLPSLYAGRTVVVLGEKPRVALELPKQLIHPHERDGVTWRQLPHPSGLNLWYNDADNRELAASLLFELYTRGTT